MGNVADDFKSFNSAGSVRLGLGERVDRAGDLARLRAQDTFLRALQAEAPQVMLELYDPHVLEAYLRWDARLQGQIDAGDKPESIDPMNDPEMSPFFFLLVEWCERWNLRTVWMLKAAQWWLLDRYELVVGGELPPEYDYAGLPSVMLGKLEDLVRSPGQRARFHYNGYPDSAYWPMEVFPSISDPFDLDPSWFDWNPATETRAENERRAVARFRKLYRSAQDARLHEAEERYPNRVQSRSFDHFRWLVQYQSLGWSYSRIAKVACKSRQTVSDAIHATAELLDLPLRKPDPPGRKPKQAKTSGNPATSEY